VEMKRFRRKERRSTGPSFSRRGWGGIVRLLNVHRKAPRITPTTCYKLDPYATATDGGGADAGDGTVAADGPSALEGGSGAGRV
jgi:hypothetical protein